MKTKNISNTHGRELGRHQINADHSDLSLFKNRLWKLMQEKELKSANELAAKLYDNGYAKVDHRERNEEFSLAEARRMAIGSISKKISKHLDSDDVKDVQGEYLLAYCKYFNCSGDYLLGLIPMKTHAHIDLSDYLGLSELATDNLYIAAGEIDDGPLDNSLADDRINDDLRSSEIGRVAKIRFLQLLLENTELWEKISVDAYDYYIQMEEYQIDNYHTIEGIPHNVFARVVLDQAKECLSSLFQKMDSTLFDILR